MRLATGLQAKVLLDRVDEVGSADPRALIHRVEDVGQQQEVLEPVGVVLLQVTAAGAGEPFERLSRVPAVDGSPCLGELSVRVGSHGGQANYTFGTILLRLH